MQVKMCKIIHINFFKIFSIVTIKANRNKNSNRVHEIQSKANNIIINIITKDRASAGWSGSTRNECLPSAPAPSV